MSGKILVIVESPGKTGKIQGILGNKYKVIASVGHIIDLPPKEMGIVIDDNFRGIYKPIKRKTKDIKNIKECYKSCSDIIIATDEDREGEMIAWSIAYVLKLDNPKRIVFNSITKSDILKAVQNPKAIDMDMVNAQMARRVADRLVGFELSPEINKYLSTYGLSAGRVQSVVVKIIIEKEKEIKEIYEKGLNSSFKIRGEFKNKIVLNGVMCDSKGKKQSMIKECDTVRELLENFKLSVFTICDIKKKEKKTNPPVPYTTATMQQDTYRRYKFSSKNTMMYAQRLYEAGLITYMRTDSICLSSEAIKTIEKYIKKNIGAEYYQKRVYKNSKAAQEAHEAIRPTYIEKRHISPTGKVCANCCKLYSMIWERTIASQLKSAVYDVTDFIIDIDNDDNHCFKSTEQILKYKGYLIINDKIINNTDNCNINDISNNFNIGDGLDLILIEGKTEYQRPPARYNEGSLIKKLSPDNLNIGRPSTYAAIISKILNRKYVDIDNIGGKEFPIEILKLGSDKNITEESENILIGSAKNVLIPTEMGEIVNNYLVEYFSNIMDVKFTADMELELDNIAKGKKDKVQVISELYNSFHPTIEKLRKEKVALKEKYTRNLGKDPKTSDDIIAYIGKYGPLVMRKCTGKKDTYAPIKKPLTIESITLKQVLTLLEYPKPIGKYNRKNISLKKGKYGLYIEYNKNKISLGDKTDITLDEAIELIKKREPKKSLSDEKYSYQVLNGPYGEYIKVIPNKKGLKGFNVAIPENTNIDKLDLDQIKSIIDAKYNKNKKKTYYKSNRGRGRGKKK